MRRTVVGIFVAIRSASVGFGLRNRLASGVMAQNGLTRTDTNLALKVDTEENAHAAELVVTLAEVGDKVNFKRLLPLCAEFLSSAYAAVGAMAWLYPERADELTALVKF